MKDFLIKWFAWQVLVLSLANGIMWVTNPNPNQTVSCGVGRDIGLITVSIITPVIIFTSMSPYDCK